MSNHRVNIPEQLAWIKEQFTEDEINQMIAGFDPDGNFIGIGFIHPINKSFTQWGNPDKAKAIRELEGYYQIQLTQQLKAKVVNSFSANYLSIILQDLMETTSNSLDIAIDEAIRNYRERNK